MARFTDFDQLEVIAPNFKRRLSGVTSTIIQLVPTQYAAGLGIAVFGEGLPEHLPRLAYRDFWRLWKRPESGKKRVWHARRNVEMLAGIVMRDVLRMPLKLVFTSAAQRKHTSYTHWLLRQMNVVVATSKKSAAFLDSQSIVIMHGIDTERFVPPESKAVAKQTLGFSAERKIVGCTGRVRASKGTDLFVEAMISLLPKFDEWDALITGRATAEHLVFQTNLMTKIANAGLQERIRFVGEVDDILPFYQAFDLFVAPSRNEGFGLTPLEAMSCGVPIVATDAGSYSAMVGANSRGRIVNAGNLNELKMAVGSALEEFCEFSSTREAQIRDHVLKNFSLNGEARDLIEIYRRLLN